MKVDLGDKGFLEFLISIAEEDVIEYYWHWIELDGYKYIIKFDDEYEDYCHEEDNLNYSEGWFITKFSMTSSVKGVEYYFCDDHDHNLNHEDIQRFEKLRLTYKLQKTLKNMNTKTKQTKI